MKKFDVKEIFGDLIAFCLRPCKTYDKKGYKFDIKNSFIFAGIIAVLIMIANILGALIGAIYTKACFLGYCQSSWFNFGLIDWASCTYQILLVSAIAMLAIAGIFYLAGLVIKKEVKFEKLLTIVSVCLIPSIVGAILSSILGLIWGGLATITAIAIAIYEIITLVTLLNKEFAFENDKKVVFYTVVLTIIAIIAYVVIVNLLTSLIGSSIAGLLK